MSKKTKDIKAIFWEVVEKENREEQMAYLEKACGGNAEARAKVEELLKAHEEANGFLDISPLASNVTLDEPPLVEAPGTVIGRYKLLEKIGEGGMAVVYMAEQEKPIRRKVALKIIKLGMDTRSVIARFEAERQALAMMDHPNIAKVLDAGATETGRPYFVMELVTGVSITDYCDANNLSTKERLELFIQVCNAVQHAHQKGIIHRDIKPTNVMVTHQDGKPIPKVIDFGIAKATNHKLTEKTLFTRYAHIIGTPAYMSPEQAELSDLDIDTRTDIYSLGVLLYELLTGTPPFGEEELRNAGYLEMQRIIREQEPVRPSTKLSTLGGTLTDIAKSRSTSPEVLTKSLRGDLDWIVMKALEKDRSRRYEAANMLASDIRHHLNNEPVMARGPSTSYRLKKFLRRHRIQTIASLAFVVIVCVMTVILSMWNKDRLQLSEAEGFRHRGILSQAREQYAKAQRDEAIETIKPILNSYHVGPDARLLYALVLIDNRRSDEAVTILRDLLNDSPEIAGAAHSLLARILWESESPDAEKLKEIDEHRRQAEALLPETAEAYFLRAMTAVTVKEKLALLDKALELDPAHYESRRLRAFTYYASRKYDKMRDDALVMEVSRPRDPLGYSLRAVGLRELGKYKDAIAEYDKAIALTPEKDPQYIDLCLQRCETLLYMGDYERVISNAKAYLKISPKTIAFQYHIFCAMTALGDYENATDIFEKIISTDHEARQQFRGWCAKYVFDTLEAGRSWYLQDRKPSGAAFLPLVEAEETYRSLAAKGRRLTTNGFSANWSPDGKKLAFSAGVQGYSGVAVYDMATKETDLLIVPGKDPRWSPDGKYIAFVRDCQLLRLEEMVMVENNRQKRAVADEEVWVMKSDGTEPRLLARGSWPSWAPDSEHIYYQSRVDNVLYSISIVDQNPEPKQIMKCSYSLASVSPDNQKVSSFEGGKLTIKDLTSEKLVTALPVSSISSSGVTSWSATRNEVCLGDSNESRGRTGLWIYDVDKKELLSVLEVQISSACWSSDGKALAFCIGRPYLEIWAADLDPNISTIEALGPGRTIDEHIRKMFACYNRRIAADPEDAYAYSDRAHYYDCLNDKAKAKADMRRWSAVLSNSECSPIKAHRTKRIIKGPFDYQIVFSAERPVNKTPLLSVAFGQKGRCNMKTFQIPILSTRGLAMSLLCLCLLSGLDSPPAHADFVFGEPVNLGPSVNSSSGETIDSLSADGLEMYLTSNRSGGQGAWDIWVATREAIDDDWGTPVNLGPLVNSGSQDWCPYISADGLELYLTSGRSGGYGSWDIWVTRRATKDDAWGSPENLGPLVNSSNWDGTPWVSSDGLELYFYSLNRAGGYGGIDIWISRRATKNDPWGEPVNLGPPVNSSAHDTSPFLSSDGLLLFFSGEIMTPFRSGGFGGSDMWMSRRASISDPWGEPVNLGPIVNSPSHDCGPRLSPDGSMLYFCSERPGGFGGMYGDIYQVPILPIVDFNSDGKVDAADVCIMIQHWLTDYPLCDIGPMPWGDGIVDVQDLIVLSKHLFEDYRLVAHWAMDEDAGNTAYDSVGKYDASLQGGPIWQPGGGKLNGSLQFDGIDDYVSTPFIINPANGSFSVSAWIKGGSPGQVIISQGDVGRDVGNTWLLADASYGRLTTRLMHPPFQPLVSESVITDDQWHHVGLVYDFVGLHRYLYVDGIEVAKDSDFVGGVGSDGNLYIGVDKTLQATTFFSGLIDDVRIYNNVLNTEEIAALAQ